MSYVILDLETTTRTEFKRKATPFNNRNRIVAIGYKKKGETRNTGKYFATGKSEAGEYVGGAPDGWLVPLLEGTSVLAGFNIKFDVLHAICQGPSNRQAWIEYIDRGGKVWDGQLAEYLLNGMSHEYQMASLDETAPRYGGNLKNDAVKALWAAGVETYDIDKDMLMEYLVGYESWHNEPHPAGMEDFGDIGNTEKVFLGQVEALRARKGLKSAVLNMGALVFTIEAEYSGMYVDLPWALGHAEVLKQQLAEATAELDTFIPKDLPFGFKWTSRFHKSALIFGGDVKYESRCPILDSSGQQVYAQMDQERVLLEGYNPKGTAEEQALHTAAADLLRWQMEDPETAPLAATYSGGKNKGEIKTKKFKVPDPSKPKSRMETFTYRFPGYTQPEKKWEGADAGVYSTAADVIEELAGRNIPFLRALARRADIHKDLSTYFITTDEDSGESKGMLTLVGPDGIVHHQLHMTSTVTGRLSSASPNLQNISKGSYDAGSGESKGSQIKRAFVSRFEEGGRRGKIIQSDFTSLEIYVQASLTMCKQLIEDLRLGLDMHCLRAEQAWGAEEGKNYDYILAASKNEQHPEHQKWKEIRQNAKEFSFQR